MARDIHIGDITLSEEEATETLAAIRAGQVDAVVINAEEGDQVYTFRDPSHPYRLLVETMIEGAALLSIEGVLCYHNARFAELAGETGASLVGRRLSEIVAPSDAAGLATLVEHGRSEAARAEVSF